ncbi:UDP-N-acetylglucosamine--N-acetylmuramyl-(pentapeptide) pyrophosphoryl-undecaprenol N-acetylglucosamine transferase [Kordiimonas sediminis]|uniref:UDP-N-acetylglucosamine--N-acetylmuramyl-(pentapeptide) pyrophosphoryl-undecaprenol N-acetylglucosamine transferase n=1 Tax=Kordiimonas sediminis TaxID=1735581 RepID=A0A919ATX1_9PROT|nr:undecaprenyldiphospho-muramoylpentapeptide beta-N-acetylglucosaminyltransferase [Kordiimonas sediminis]GHF23149.1 UDP-N-acetylglucosamine--N-acetylmuramyl-(pentapeptide) pyrophosphoryl-undecaprenol N-acetylglucosamine transferase [Kordiimonas sediminis]
MTETFHIVVAAGGTGGHMVPAGALADALLARGHRVSLVTDERGNRFTDTFADMPKHVLHTQSHMAGGLMGKIKSLWSIWKSTREVKGLFWTWQPDCVVGFGGYPSMPGILAASAHKIPVVLHEQNAVLGRVNRWMAREALVVALSYDPTARVPAGVKTLFTGNPVRSEILSMKDTPYSYAKGGVLNLLILGGSQGARILSDIVPDAVAVYAAGAKAVSIVHQARAEDVDRVQEVYEKAGIDAVVQPFFTDIPDKLMSADLVIARSGASTLSELTVLGRPSILVPLAIAADDHQSANARQLKEVGAAWVLPEAQFTVDVLAGLLEDVTGDEMYLKNAARAAHSCARPKAAEKLADCVLKQIRKKAA